MLLPLIACDLLACDGGPSTTRSPEPPAEAVHGEADGPAPSDSGTPRFWVADDGLVAYDLDGNRLTQLGPAGLDRARRLADGGVVGLAEPEAGPLTLFVLDPAGAVVRELALPDSFAPESCEISPTQPGGDRVGELLYVQAPRDFQTRDGAACVSLLDRNENMASYGLDLTVDLASGGVLARVGLDAEESCTDRELLTGTVAARCEPGAANLPWVESAAAETSRDDFPARFDEPSRTVTIDAVVARLCPPGHTSESPDDDWGICSEFDSRSPTGRWELLTGLWSEGDSIYRDVLLFDRSDGSLWQIDTSDDAPRFVPVAPADIFTEASEYGRLALVGESDYAWLPGDRLWIDGWLLILDQRRVVTLGGVLARIGG